jgi:hypothetical protein
MTYTVEHHLGIIFPSYLSGYCGDTRVRQLPQWPTPQSEKEFCTGRCDGRDSGEFSNQIKPKSSLKRQQQE